MNIPRFMPGHVLHTSEDIPQSESPLAGRRTRPVSEAFSSSYRHSDLGGYPPFGLGGSTGSGLGSLSAGMGNLNLGGPSPGLQHLGGGLSNTATMDSEKWLQDLELYNAILEEMATVSLDKDFKDELSSIEQWFGVLSDGERTAALYALLQQTNPVQIRFFITVLQKFGNLDFDGSPIGNSFENGGQQQQQTTSAQPSPMGQGAMGQAMTGGLGGLGGLHTHQNSHSNLNPNAHNPIYAPVGTFPTTPSHKHTSSLSTEPIGSRRSMIATPEHDLNAQIANTTAMKLAALSTVSNRASLDDRSKRSSFHQHTNSQESTPTKPGTPGGSPAPGSHSLATPMKGHHQTSSSSSITQLSGGASSASPATDLKLLRDVSAWLRALRLHKYTECFKDMEWQDIVQLDDAQLEEKGVNALGARRKMLKVFEQVRDAQKDGTLSA
ncbi:Protein VTS1 [Yarrowia sp. C11]|nr:Protein VTS1 [Yarrowia sp. E02]KAG5367359.1 Protein VTS1 [Yarrowia sp. C11]